jgi:hypothetical protein
MRNRAKCKLCQAVIESFHAYDYVECKCGEIAVEGGESLKVYAKDFSNFLRVDDLGNEIIVQVQDVRIHNMKQDENVTKHNKKELLKMLEEMINNIQNLPQAAMVNPINHYDFCSALLLILATLRSES